MKPTMCGQSVLRAICTRETEVLMASNVISIRNSLKKQRHNVGKSLLTRSPLAVHGDNRRSAVLTEASAATQTLHSFGRRSGPKLPLFSQAEM